MVAVISSTRPRYGVRSGRKCPRRLGSSEITRFLSVLYHVAAEAAGRTLPGVGVSGLKSRNEPFSMIASPSCRGAQTFQAFCFTLEASFARVAGIYATGCHARLSVTRIGPAFPLPVACGFWGQERTYVSRSHPACQVGPLSCSPTPIPETQHTFPKLTSKPVSCKVYGLPNQEHPLQRLELCRSILSFVEGCGHS